MQVDETAQVTASASRPRSTAPSRRAIVAVLLLTAAFGSLLVYMGYKRVKPTPTTHEVPQTIEKFMLERVAFAEGNLLSNERHFVATYVANDKGLPRRLTYSYRRLSDPVIAMQDPQLKCAGSLEDEGRVLDVRHRQIGRAAYCNSSTPFFWITLDDRSHIVRSDFADIPQERLQELALRFGRPLGAYLSGEQR